ncbi:MAG: glycine cleavage system protein H [Pirellulaceae bacterium]
MSDHLRFMMAQREACFPTDRRYATNHMWAVDRPYGVIRFGFTAYAVRLMLDVYFLEWHVDAGAELAFRHEMGAIESKKAESSLFAPIAGRLTRFNEALLSDPSTINLDNYGDGWLFEIEGPDHELLLPEAYLHHVKSVWKVAQKTIRGI